MGKKSFLEDNPALAFISQESIDKVDGTTHKATPKKKHEQRGNSEEKTLQKRERRSHRLQVLLTPSLYESMKRVADEEGMKLNELINIVLQDFIETR